MDERQYYMRQGKINSKNEVPREIAMRELKRSRLKFFN